MIMSENEEKDEPLREVLEISKLWVPHSRSTSPNQKGQSCHHPQNKNPSKNI